MASRGAAAVYVVDSLAATVRAKKPFTFGVKGTVDGEPEATRGHKLDVTFPSGPRAVLPAKVKDNLKVKGAWLVEALLPADGDYVMSIKVDGKDITGSPFTVKADATGGGSAAPSPAVPHSTSAPNVLSSSAAFDTPAAAALSSSPANPSALARDYDKQPAPHQPLNDEPVAARPGSAAAPAAAAAAAAAAPLSSSPATPSALLRTGGPRERKVTWSVVGIEEKIASRIEAGRPMRFQLHCRDQNGIWAPSTAKIEPKFTGPRAIFPSLAAAHPGVWVIEWAATIAGDYTLVVYVDGQQVAGPYTLPVQAPELTREQILDADNKRLAAPVPEPENPLRPKITDEMVNTTLDALKQTEETKRIWHMFGEGKKGATSGKMARFEMHAKDQYGTFVPLPTLHYLRVDFEGPAPIFPSRHEHQSIRGIYIIEYKPVAAGPYTMHIKVDGEPIEGSPFQIVVAEGEKVQGIYYEATGPGIEGATSGVAAKFQVQARDQDGLPAASAAVMRVKFEGPRPVFPHVQRKEDKKGFYIVEYCASKAGAYQMFVTADDQPIEGSPFAITVAQGGRAEVGSSNPIASSDPASASSSSSSLHSSAGQDAKAPEQNRGPTVDRSKCEVSGMVAESHVGRSLAFTVLARSRHVEPVSGAKFDISITEIKSGTVIPFLCAETSNGAHAVNYTPTVPGAYRVNVDFEGAPLNKSPFRVAIKDKPSAVKSPMSRPSFFLQARTFAGDALADGGDEVQFTIEGPESVQTTVKDMGTGSYVLNYTQPTVPGFYIFNVKLNGEHVQNSPWTVALGSAMSAAPLTEEDKRRVQEEAQKREERRVAEEAERARRDEDERRMRDEVAKAKAIEEEERKKREAAEAEAKRKAILASGEGAAQSELIEALREELATVKREKDALIAKIASAENAEVERKAKEEAARAAAAEAERKAREAAEKKAKEKADRRAKEEAERLEREAALAEKARQLAQQAEVEQNREVVKGDMSNTKTAAYFKKEAQEAAAMLRARRQKELEDKQRESEEKAKRDAEAEEKAKADAALAPPTPQEPKASIKDRGAALNLRVGALIPGSAPPPRKAEDEPASPDSTSPAAPPAAAAAAVVEEKFATKNRPAGAAARRRPTRPRRGAAAAGSGEEKKDEAEAEADHEAADEDDAADADAKSEAGAAEAKAETTAAPETSADSKSEASEHTGADAKSESVAAAESVASEGKKEEAPSGTAPTEEKKEAEAASKPEAPLETPAEAKAEPAADAPKEEAKAEAKSESTADAPKEEAKAEAKSEPATDAPKAEAKSEPATDAPKEETKSEAGAEEKKEPPKEEPKHTDEKKEQVGRAKISLSALRNKTSTNLAAAAPKAEEKKDEDKTT